MHVSKLPAHKLGIEACAWVIWLVLFTVIGETQDVANWCQGLLSPCLDVLRLCFCSSFPVSHLLTVLACWLPSGAVLVFFTLVALEAVHRCLQRFSQQAMGSQHTCQCVALLLPLVVLLSQKFSVIPCAHPPSYFHHRPLCSV